MAERGPRDGGAEERGSRPRLIVNFGSPDLDEFGSVAAAAAEHLGRDWDVRFVVSHLAAKDRTLRTDPGDPYLEYAANFPDLFHFVVPGAVQPEIDPARVESHVRLAEQKLAILRPLGLGGAFLGREPAFLPEPLLARLPTWRGPRVDHPRRSRNPVFAPCLHQPDVQRVYRDTAEALVRRLPGVDTFFWWTNDSGSGFCWYPFAYPGPNGPSWCRDLGPIPAMAAFHAAILDGAREGGATEPISVMTQVRIWDPERMPAGALRYPPPDGGPGAASIRADVSLTYPIRSLWDPVGRLEQLQAVAEARPAVVMWWLSDVYHRASIDAPSAVDQIRLWASAAAEPARMAHLTGRTRLVRDHARSGYGEAAADDVVDAWARLHAASTLQTHSPFPTPLVQFLPTYGPISHRWLTRPMVAFPAELSADQEAHWLPHVFAVGDEARRGNLLDVNGYRAVAEGEAHDLRSPFFRQIEGALLDAATAFDCGANLAAGPDAAADLRRRATCARLLACVWATIRNWLEFAALRSRGVEGSPAPGTAAELEAAEAYRRQLFAILRAELDNTQALQGLLGDDPEGLLARATRPEDEDPFLLGPDVGAQLTKKRQTMLAHWPSVARLVPRAEA